MNNKKSVLFIVEGEKVEKTFFSQLAKLYDIDFDIVCLKSNIYSLYSRMKKYDFNVNIASVLEEIHPEYKNDLSKKFLYTYLIFDCDVHHTKKNESRILDDYLADNFAILSEMTDYFTNETDPTIGKLYINYPMMDSFRDCDSFFDDNYENAIVEINHLNDYKPLISCKKMVRIHIKDIQKDDFELLMLQNIYKLGKIMIDKWAKIPYNKYLTLSNQNAIVKKESNYCQSKKIISVLNTSLFFIIDYFGNSNGFYDYLNKK